MGANAASKTTPMMEQYLGLKRQAGGSLLFYRMGDFFELFFDDAKIASEILDIALTSRGEHNGEPVAMCGVPVHSAEGYLARLIKAGQRVAIAEQVETPDEAKARAKREGKPSSKALVTRDIVRFVTAGTLTEEALLEPRRANVLAALAEVRGTIGIASCDISTGIMVLEECSPELLSTVLARLSPKEIVVPEGWPHGPDIVAQHNQSAFSSDLGKDRLRELHSVSTLDGFGDFSRAMLAAAAGQLAYLDHVGRGTLPLLLPPKARASSSGMVMDETTRTSLEILEATNGGRTGSLVWTLDRCSTGAGSRLLAQDLAAPLLGKDAIEGRLALVQFWRDRPIERANLRDCLRAMPDIGRALGRIAADRGSPRDLGQIRDGLAEASRLYDWLTREADKPSLLNQLVPKLAGHGALTDLLTHALVEAPPTERSSGGYIAPGYDAALDELREVSGNAKRAIAAMEARYRNETGITSLKIKHNGVLGYFIEVPNRHADPLMSPESGFTHRQTMKGAVRFNSLALHEEANLITESGGRAIAAEEAHFEDLVAHIVHSKQSISETAQALARLDVGAANAERAAEGDWSHPVITEDRELRIEGGRHPVVEAALAKSGERFVANDCSLKADDHLWLIGGPNMAASPPF